MIQFKEHLTDSSYLIFKSNLKTHQSKSVVTEYVREIRRQFADFTDFLLNSNFAELPNNFVVACLLHIDRAELGAGSRC